MKKPRIEKCVAFLRLVFDLPDGDLVEEFEELGEADGGGFRALDQRVAGGAECCDAEGHGDAVVVAGVDGGAVELAGCRERRGRRRTLSTSAPIARRFFATRAMRSDSLTRSSLASRMRMPPRE